jgi:hypothetical protein
LRWLGIDKKTVWLGMTDEQTEAHWGWTDGSPFDYKKWHKVDIYSSNIHLLTLYWKPSHFLSMY